MKNLLILFVILSFSIAIFADDIYVKRGEERAAGFVITGDELLNRTAPSLVLECQFSKLEANVVNTELGNFTLLNIPGFHSNSSIGDPRVPIMNRLLELPFGVKPTVKILSYTEQEYSLKDWGIVYPLMPCQPSLRKDFTILPLSYNAASYQQDEYTKNILANIVEVGVMRNFNLFMVEVAPIVYNPVQGKVKVYNDIRFEITLEGSDIKLTAVNQQKYYSPYFSWTSNQVLTPQSLNTLRGDVVKLPVTYVIVADRMFANDLKSFVDWKIAKGFKVIEAYTDTIGKTKEEIQKYLHNLYNNATTENPAPSFVLLVGDLAQIPAFSGTAGSYVTDLYYVAVTADKIPDMYCGRFSAQNSAQLLPQIEKTLEYEQYLFADPSFLQSAVLVAGWDSSHAVEWGWPQINYATTYYFNKNAGYTNVSAFLTSGSQQNASKIVSAVGNGAAFVNYTAHGSTTDWSDPNFTKGNIESLQNKGKYPLVIGNCCLTNSFQIDVCFGEAWLRAKDKGAIGYIGGSSYTYWDEDLWWGNGYYPIKHPNSQGTPPTKDETGVGAYEGAIEKDYCSNAGLMLAGNLAVEESPSSRKVYYWEVYHLMGDPSVMVYWGIPVKMTVTHPDSIKVSDKTITVKAEVNAYVGISQNGELVGAGVAKENGEAKIDLNGLEEGTAKIVVTKKNRQPYTGSVTVVK